MGRVKNGFYEADKKKKKCRKEPEAEKNGRDYMDKSIVIEFKKIK